MGGPGSHAWLGGYVDLEIRTAQPEVMLNALLEQGVSFASHQGEDGTVRLRVAVAQVRRLRPAARAAGARVRIVRRAGAPFALARVRRRPWLWGSAVVAVAIGQFLSGYVWFVQVQGTDRLAPAEIAAAAAGMGLRPGVRRSSVDASALGRRLTAALPELAWAGVTLHGTLAEISVAERPRPAPGYEQAAQAGDIVAAHAGRIWSLRVLSGVPMVQPGQEVTAGQVLIRGAMRMPVARNRSSGPEGVRDVPVHASGLIIARQWYSSYAEAPRTVAAGLPTGRQALRRVVEVGRFRVDSDLWRGRPFAAYELARSQWGPVRLGPLVLPVHVLTLRYSEVRTHYRRLSLSEAEAVATAEARSFLLSSLPSGARIIAQHHSWQELAGGRVGVELQVESEDNIGVFRPTASPGAG